MALSVLARRTCVNGSSSVCRVLARAPARRGLSTTTDGDIFSPTPDHAQLREVVRKWVETEVNPQALEFNREERFNRDLFRKLGEEVGVLGITVDPDFGGAGAGGACLRLLRAWACG